MPYYRYYTADILSGVVQAELSLYGVYFNRALSDVGDFTGTFKLSGAAGADGEILDATSPGKNAIFVERDGTLIWGGIVWSRTWDEESNTCQITAQTYESIFDHVALENDFVHQVEDQMQILKAMIDAVQLQRNNNFGLNTSTIGTCGVNRTVLIPGYEYHYAQEVVDEVVGVDDGVDYTIDILPGIGTDVPRKVVRVGYPTLGSRGQELLPIFEFPGNILTFWWPESATKGGTRFVGLGAGSGIEGLRSQLDAEDLLRSGYPSWYVVKAYKGITFQSTLNDQVAADRDLFKMPVAIPTFELKSDRVPEFESWNDLGASFKVHIESPRFPDGKETVTRMIGWELTIADEDSVESLKFFIEGGDDV